MEQAPDPVAALLAYFPELADLLSPDELRERLAGMVDEFTAPPSKPPTDWRTLAAK